MPYPFDQIFAADPDNTDLVASNASVLIFAPGDATKAPLALKTIAGLPLPNPVPVNDRGFGPAFMADLDQVAWEGGGFSGLLVSYKGLKDEAVGARAAAQAAALEAQAPTDASVDRGIQRANVPGVVAEIVASNPTVTNAAAGLAQSTVGLVRKTDPGAPSSLPSEDLLAVITDSKLRKTWLGARATDGGPSENAMRHLNDRLGVQVTPTPFYLAALSDSSGRLTDFAIRASDGQVDDFVIERWAGRLRSHFPEATPGNTGLSSDVVPLLQSLAAAAARYADGAQPPSSPVSFTANGQAARLTFPTRYSDATPVPLVIQFEGVGDRTLDPRAAYRDPVRDLGALYAKCTFHGDSYGSPDAMADARAVYEYALRIAPISNVILVGNSMGGIGALNALQTGAIPNVTGLYLTDPTYDLRQRYDGGRANEIKAAYGISGDGSDYITRTEGHDPALAPARNFRGVPIRIVASSGDASVSLALHGMKLMERLRATNPVDLIDTQTAGHNTADRFIPTDLTNFIAAASGGTIGLRP